MAEVLSATPEEKATPYSDRTYRSLIAGRLASKAQGPLDVPMIFQLMADRADAEKVWASGGQRTQKYGGEPLKEDKKKDKMAGYVPYRIKNPWDEEMTPVSDRVRRSRIAAQLASRPSGQMNLCAVVQDGGL